MNIIVIGGGPAGIMAALAAAHAGAKDITMYEKKGAIGTKLSITGKGRCNVTSSCTIDEIIEKFGKRGRFLYPALNGFSPDRMLEYLHAMRIKTVHEHGKRYYLASNKAIDLCRAFEKALERACVKVICNHTLEAMHFSGDMLAEITVSGKHIACKNTAVILAGGGITYPQTGSDGFITGILKKAGLTVTPQRGMLVPFHTSIDRFCMNAQGNSLKNIGITLAGKKMQGELSFVTGGVGGPLIQEENPRLLEYFNNHSECPVSLDFKPALSPEQIKNRISREKNDGKRTVGDFAGGFIPAFFREVFYAVSRMQKNKPLDTVMENRLIQNLKDFSFELTGPFDGEHGIVTEGGVVLSEIDPKTMCLKKYRNLYVAGEMIDLNGPCGGFNLQMAFSTGYCAGSAAAQAEC